MVDMGKTLDYIWMPHHVCNRQYNRLNEPELLAISAEYWKIRYDHVKNHDYTLQWLFRGFSFPSNDAFIDHISPICKAFIAYRDGRPRKDNHELMNKANALQTSLLVLSYAHPDCLALFEQTIEKMDIDCILKAEDEHELVVYLSATYSCIKAIHAVINKVLLDR